MKKRILSILLTLCMVISLVPTGVFAVERAAKDTAAITFDTRRILSPTKVTNGKNVHFEPNSYIYFGINGVSTLYGVNYAAPIKWRVLDAEKACDGKTNGMFLLSEYLLAHNVEYKSYIFGSNKYDGSAARGWCRSFAAGQSNGIFTDPERDAMRLVTKTDKTENLYDWTWGGSGLTDGDNMFCLSVREAIDYIGNYDNAPGLAATDIDGNSDGWWLRSHIDNARYVSGIVSFKGLIDFETMAIEHSTRPAFNLNKDSIKFISAAAGGKSVKGMENGLTAIPAYNGNEWKLTLFDNSRSEFNVLTSAVSASTEGGTIKIEYSGAKTGENESISAMILDGNTDPVYYYGRSKESLSTESGTAELAVPVGLAEGEYSLAVFSEQYNGDYKTDYASNSTYIRLTVEKKTEEQFNLAPGGKYYFDLSEQNIPGMVNGDLPDSTLHYVPFTYTGTVNSYVLGSASAGSTGGSEFASRVTEPWIYGYTYPHSLFIADYTVTQRIGWTGLDEAGFIFGKDYESGGIEYTLRAPTVGSSRSGTFGSENERGTPLRNEWDTILDKNSDYIKNWEKTDSWGQDTSDLHAEYSRADYRAFRGFTAARLWNGYPKGDNRISYRPVLEIKNADTLGADGLKAVTLNLNGCTLNGESSINYIVKNGASFTAPAKEGLTRPDGDTGDYFVWLGSNNRIYEPGDSVPETVTSLTACWDYPEEFSLEVGKTYYFDLSGENIPGTVDCALPDITLHYVPFVYVGSIDAYKLKPAASGVIEAAENASKTDDPDARYGFARLHSLFIADRTISTGVSWTQLDEKGLIFGKDYAAGGVNYTLRVPSMGSHYDERFNNLPTNNEWETIVAKNAGFIKNMEIPKGGDLFLYWGQDTRDNGPEYRVLRYFTFLANMGKDNVTDGAYRPVLEVQNAGTLGRDGLKVVSLCLGGGSLNGEGSINLVVKNGESFIAPTAEGLPRPDGASADAPFRWIDENGNCYKPGDTVPAGVSKLSIADGYEVTYLPGAYGEGSTVTDLKPFDDVLTLRDALFTRKGYTQVGWAAIDGGEKVYGFEDIYTANKALMLYPVWSPNRYTVTFDGNGGTVAQETMTVTYGEELDQMPIPRYKGYFFDGWFDEKWGGRQYSDKYGHSTTRYDKTEDCTLYAMWVEAPICTVTFDPNGGTLAGAATCEEKQNECISRPDEEPVREGYNFLGWYKDAACTQRWDFDDPIPGNMTLYAGWQILSYTIRVKPANGEQDIIIDENYGTAITPPLLTREGYTFIGWDTPFPEKMPAKIMTITAQWKINQYTITFDTAGGSEVGSKTLSWNDKVLDGVAKPIRNGYNFVGWKYNDNIVVADTVYADLAVDDSIKSITLTAQWSERSDYTVSFNTAGGNDVADRTNVKWTDKVLEGVEAPLRNTYEFIGWTYNDRLITADTVYADLAVDDSVESITLTAQWKDIEKPTGEIRIGENSWKMLLNKITFGLFFKDKQTVSISASDNSGDDVMIEYMLSGRELTESELASAAFTEYTGQFDINPDNEYIIYARLTDKANNVAYICSIGIVLDATNPVIGGVENGKIYCAAQIVTITEKHVKTVTVNGTEVTLDENNSFVLAPAGGEQKIVVIDSTGNTAEMIVTVNNGHTAAADDGDCTTPVYCKICNAEVVAARQHDFSGDLQSDESSHWHICENSGCIVTDTKIAHSGTDDSDCTTAVVCGECGYVITEAKPEHTFDEWTSGGNGTHTRKCTVPGCTAGVQTENCRGEAYCTAKAVCDICGDSYGELAPDNHSGTLDWIRTDTAHEKKWDCCGTIVVAKEEHKWENGICAECGYGCAHTGGKANCHTKAVCELCHNLYGELDRTNHDGGTEVRGAIKATCMTNGYTGDTYCLGCEAVLAKGSEIAAPGHTGGKATCKDKAICDVCKEAYGELDEKNHDDLKHIPAKAATKDAEGNTEYWHCDSCDKYFGDAETANEISKADIFIKKLSDDQKSPQTDDDSNLVLWLALLFVSGVALTGIAVCGKKKKFFVK